MKGQKLTFIELFVRAFAALAVSFWFTGFIALMCEAVFNDASALSQIDPVTSKVKLVLCTALVAYFVYFEKRKVRATIIFLLGYVILYGESVTWIFFHSTEQSSKIWEATLQTIGPNFWFHGIFCIALFTYLLMKKFGTGVQETQTGSGATA